MNASASQRSDCRLCAEPRLELALHLAPTPLGDDFIADDHTKHAQGVYPLDLMLCPKCGNVQLSEVVNPDIVYREYKYTSSVSIGLPAHFQAYADALLTETSVAPHDLVIEIGSNEGTMLRAFQNRGMRTLGVDPALEIAGHALASGIETLPTYFTTTLAREIRQERGQATIVIANNVFANIDDVVDVVHGVRTLLAPNGIFVFETSYWLDVVENALIDTIFHEHLTYFCVGPLVSFFSREGMKLVDVQRVPTKGGSVRCTIQLAAGRRPISSSVSEHMKREKAAALNSPVTYEELAARLGRQRTELQGTLEPLRERRGVIAGYGASVGTTTMIYHFGLGELLDFLVDDNPRKHHTLSPGLHLPTLPSSALYDRGVGYAAILAWRYSEEILGRHSAFLERGGRFLAVHPQVRTL